MAYNRKRRNYRPKRPRRAKASPSFGAQAITALKGYALLKLKQKLGLNPESKFVDVAGNTTSTSTLASRIAMATIPQGNTIGTRSGASIRISKVETRISAVATAGATAGTNIRIIQLRHSQPSAPGVAEILESTTDIASPINNEAKDNGITILRDEVLSLGTALSGNSAVYTQWTHVGLADHVVYPDADTTGLPADTVKGLIATYWFCDNITSAPYFTAKSRYWFVDN